MGEWLDPTVIHIVLSGLAGGFGSYGLYHLFNKKKARLDGGKLHFQMPRWKRLIFLAGTGLFVSPFIFGAEELSLMLNLLFGSFAALSARTWVFSEGQSLRYDPQADTLTLYEWFREKRTIPGSKVVRVKPPVPGSNAFVIEIAGEKDLTLTAALEGIEDLTRLFPEKQLSENNPSPQPTLDDGLAL